MSTNLKVRVYARRITAENGELLRKWPKDAPSYNWVKEVAPQEVDAMLFVPNGFYAVTVQKTGYVHLLSEQALKEKYTPEGVIYSGENGFYILN